MPDQQMEIEEFLRQLVSKLNSRFESLEAENSRVKMELAMLRTSSKSLSEIYKRLAEAESQIKLIKEREKTKIDADLLRGLEK